MSSRSAVRFSKCAIHDDKALCTGEAEERDPVSHGIGESELTVLGRNIRELSGVYGYRNAPGAWCSNRLEVLVGVYGAGSVTVWRGFGLDILSGLFGVSQRLLFLPGVPGRGCRSGQRWSSMSEAQLDARRKGSEKYADSGLPNGSVSGGVHGRAECVGSESIARL